MTMRSSQKLSRVNKNLHPYQAMPKRNGKFNGPEKIEFPECNIQALVSHTRYRAPR